jgi:hypothetical protein
VGIEIPTGRVGSRRWTSFVALAMYVASGLVGGVGSSLPMPHNRIDGWFWFSSTFLLRS